MPADRRTQALAGRRTGILDLLLDDEEARDPARDDLEQQGVLAVDVGVEAAGQHADGLRDVAHRRAGVAVLAEKLDGHFRDRLARRQVLHRFLGHGMRPLACCRTGTTSPCRS